MKLPKFQTTWGTGFGASTASPPTGMTSGGNRGPGARSLSGPSRALCVPPGFPFLGAGSSRFFYTTHILASLWLWVCFAEVLGREDFRAAEALLTVTGLCLENLLTGTLGEGAPTNRLFGPGQVLNWPLRLTLLLLDVETNLK